jgi:hypothetical protein
MTSSWGGQVNVSGFLALMFRLKWGPLGKPLPTYGPPIWGLPATAKLLNPKINPPISKFVITFFLICQFLLIRILVGKLGLCSAKLIYDMRESNCYAKGII